METKYIGNTASSRSQSMLPPLSFPLPLALFFRATPAFELPIGRTNLSSKRGFGRFFLFLSISTIAVVLSARHARRLCNEPPRPFPALLGPLQPIPPV